tara:strand:+ start:730 stop:861 length:132 start_codon:yes stop_codon:yes gene_type:complete
MGGSWKSGVDIGGMTTDVIAINTSSGEVRTAKVRSQASQGNPV